MHRIGKYLLGTVFLAFAILTVQCGSPAGDGVQPPPPARAADPDLILAPEAPECETHCREMGEQYEICSATLCVAAKYPLLDIRAFDSAEKSPGDLIELGGLFGTKGENQSVALAEEQDGKLYHRYRLEVASWENERIVARIHEEVDVGQYQLLIVYQVNWREGSLPVYMQGSETVPVAVRARD